MSNPFFERPIVNSPYEYPHQHWELDESGQPTGNLIERRRRAEFITPIPKPKKRRSSSKQEELILDEGRGLTTKKQAYDLTSVINEVRSQVDTWRNLPVSQYVACTRARDRLSISAVEPASEFLDDVRG